MNPAEGDYYEQMRAKVRAMKPSDATLALLGLKDRTAFVAFLADHKPTAHDQAMLYVMGIEPFTDVPR